MSDAYILSEKELNYIETLYVYTNMEYFCAYDSHPLDAYTDVFRRYFNEHVDSANFLGSASGREWYDMGNYRIGFMDYDKAKIANQFNVEIQYKQKHLFDLSKDLTGLDLPFGGDFSKYHIKRIDVTRIVKTKEDYLTGYAYISPYRSIASYGSTKKVETVYLGHRKSGNVFRMYDKSLELKKNTKDHPIDYGKIERFSKYFGDIEDLYTFELELHRKYLKPNFNIDTLGDLDKVYSVYKEIVGKIRIYEDNDLNKKLLKSNNRSRIESLRFVEHEEFKRVEKKKYKTSESYLIDTVVSLIRRYEVSKKVLGQSDKYSIVDKIASRIFDGKDISIEIEDNEDVEDYKKMMDSIERIREGQTDELLRESIKAFSPLHDPNLPSEIF